MANEVNYGAWNALPNAGMQFMQAYQQAKQNKQRSKMADIESRKAEIELAGMEQKANTPQKTYGDYGLKVPEYLKGAAATPEQAFDVETKLKGESQKEGQQVFNQANALRDEYVKAGGDFTKQTDALTRIRSSAASPSPAGDLALIFNYMKMLDPGSTVREGEFAQAASAGSLPTQFQQYWDKKRGGFFLADNQRGDFVNRAETIYSGAGQLHEKRKGEYSRLAQKFGLDPQSVIVALDAEAQQKAATDQGNTPQSGQPKPGDIQDGFRFKGGDPSVQANWEPIQ